MLILEAPNATSFKRCFKQVLLLLFLVSSSCLNTSSVIRDGNSSSSSTNNSSPLIPNLLYPSTPPSNRSTITTTTTLATVIKICAALGLLVWLISRCLPHTKAKISPTTQSAQSQRFALYRNDKRHHFAQDIGPLGTKDENITMKLISSSHSLVGSLTLNREDLSCYSDRGLVDRAFKIAANFDRSIILNKGSDVKLRFR